MAKILWKIDPSKSKMKFSVKHMLVSKVNGSFERFSGTWLIDSDDVSTSVIEASIDARSFSTQDEKRDQYIKGKDFFNIEEFPNILFKSNQIIPMIKDELKIVGYLSIHGTANEIVLIAKGNVRDGIIANTKINRKDFKLNWNKLIEAGGFMVGEEVTVLLEIQFIK